jgi:hypothetical protein
MWVYYNINFEGFDNSSTPSTISDVPEAISISNLISPDAVIVNNPNIPAIITFSTSGSTISNISYLIGQNVTYTDPNTGKPANYLNKLPINVLQLATDLSTTIINYLNLPDSQKTPVTFNYYDNSRGYNLNPGDGALINLGLLHTNIPISRTTKINDKTETHTMLIDVCQIFNTSSAITCNSLCQNKK